MCHSPIVCMVAVETIRLYLRQSIKDLARPLVHNVISLTLCFMAALERPMNVDAVKGLSCC